ncbi:aldehyde dehydrogenase family protein [Pseudomonas asgharzadehiana]|uniref:Aldehyde dehydrogenase family protein n=1 Tax=Pseudomonas asgharzadehiana TaxID=2842349 RepID=A0ABX8P7H9_9PSED|nr:aldehyde dehydrogenase family protein [Pseudomonas asgharzadehiana]QXH69422.1 aldehyde dehydrogenase family protein [Pseudomonas asgharzadehiana]
MFLQSKNRNRFFISGAWVSPQGQQQYHNVINPADGQVSGSVSFGSAADVDLAIQAAFDAFPEYSTTTVEFRIALLERICAVYERRSDELAEAITIEMGAPFHQLSRPLQASVGLWHFQAALAALKDFSFETQRGSTLITKEPIGVCSLITPWNWPMNQTVCKVAPALAVGCTMVLKPSQNAPYSALILAEIMEEAGVPAGVFNLVNGEGRKLGQQLASHPLVDMVSLTGSTQAGASLTIAGADTVKRMSLELGGKSANIILPDADLEQAVRHGVLHMMSNSGQSCTAPSRMLVPHALLEKVEEIITTVCSEIKVGDPMDPETTMGPMANERQYNLVRELIQVGIDEGAKLLVGGIENPVKDNAGFYISPTVFTQVDNTMRIAREEIFGPVLVVIGYDSEEEAISIANDSIYGLSGYVHSSSPARAKAVAKRMRTGMVHLCGAPIDINAPFGGYKQSGNGREWGASGLDEFLETKSIMGAL